MILCMRGDRTQYTVESTMYVIEKEAKKKGGLRKMFGCNVENEI